MVNPVKWVIRIIMKKDKWIFILLLRASNLLAGIFGEYLISWCE